MVSYLGPLDRGHVFNPDVGVPFLAYVGLGVDQRAVIWGAWSGLNRDVKVRRPPGGTGTGADSAGP